MRFRDTALKTVFFLVLLGSLLTIVWDVDDVFPFSNYPMYSKVFEPGLTTTQFSVTVEDGDGRIKKFAAALEIAPFWGASFREALFVEKDPEIVRKKLEATLLWVNRRRTAGGRPLYKSMQIYRHELPWAEFIRRRMKGENLKSLYLENSVLFLEVTTK